MKFTQIPSATFENIQLNAGILVDAFTPATGEIGNIIGATSGGVNFTDTITWKDYGEDIDNCPKNTKELKKAESHEVKMSGTFITVTVTTAKFLSAISDIDNDNANHIIPRNDVALTDFKDIWWIGDYSDKNTGDNAGFIAIHLINALNTGGFQIQSTDKDKGKFAFEFTGHYSMSEQDKVPYEIYVKQGTASTVPMIYLNTHVINIVAGDSETLIATKSPSNATVTWSEGSSSVATVTNGVVVGVGAGNTIITASITVDGVTYTDTCTAIVTASTQP